VNIVPIPLRKYTTAIIPSLILLIPSAAAADGIVVDKIYDPYVEELETEIEWRFVEQNYDRAPGVQKQSFGFGRSLSDRWAVELYAIAQKSPGENLSIDTYEAEAKWQLTEQGEYAVDWGLLFEVEREIEENAWEVSTQLLASRDFGKTTVTANFGIIYEWGETIQNEIESTLRMQVRYRLKESFEPAIELHVGQDTTAVGPAIGGLFRLSEGKKLRWEFGLFAGISESSPDSIVKANVEFEF
jgi:hypothetical protein